MPRTLVWCFVAAAICGNPGAAMADIQGLKGASPSVAVYTGLTLMRGHLASAGEIAKSGNVEGAKLHFAHPSSEIYPDIANELDARSVGFAAALSALESSSADNWAANLDGVLAAISKAEASVPAEDAGSAAFVADVAARVLGEAAGEYAAAFPAGQPVNVEEYQDSRGFVVLVAEMIARSKAALQSKDAAAAGALEAAVSGMAKAWPAIDPPSSPALAPGDVAALVDQAKASAQVLMK